MFVVCDSVFLSLTDTDSQEVNQAEDISSIKREVIKRLRDHGPTTTAKYLMDNLTRWKNEVGNVAVAGQTATGKSTFINTIRGVKRGNEGFAGEGFGDTTVEVNPYKHSMNEKIVYYDLPVIGTTTITKQRFLEKIDITVFDIFLIFTSSVLTEIDEWLVDKLKVLGTPFCLVRTKLDQDIENGKHMGDDKETVLKKIRSKMQSSVEKLLGLKTVDIFFISSHCPEIGEMSKLIQHLKLNLSKVKFEAIMLSLPTITENIIAKKYEELKIQIPLQAAAAAIPVPLIDIPINIAIISAAVKKYFEVFCLEDEYSASDGVNKMYSYTFVKEGVKTSAIGLALGMTGQSKIIFN